MTNLLLHFSRSEIDGLLVLERGEGRFLPPGRWSPSGDDEDVAGRVLDHPSGDRAEKGARDEARAAPPDDDEVRAVRPRDVEQRLRRVALALGGLDLGAAVSRQLLARVGEELRDVE